MTSIIPVVVDEREADDIWDDWDNADWGSAGNTDHGTSTRYSPSKSEITQDILIPEGEFNQYAHEYPFDVAGARHDGLDDDDIAGADEQTSKFHRIPSGSPTRARGKHRITAPPNALRGGRAAFIAMAAGAAVAAVATQSSGSQQAQPEAPVAAANVHASDPALPDDTGPGVTASSASQDTSMYSRQLGVGKQLAAAEAARRAAASKPLFASPIDFSNPSCAFTSLFAMRWGSMHGGIDLACPLGTPIHAVTDGIVKQAGPASGYGNWVQIQAADGTITMYGHMSSSGVLVQKGQRVTAGQVIALVGNEGFSTGPHCHFEVWKKGVTKIDPAPWLASKGIRLPNYSG